MLHLRNHLNNPLGNHRNPPFHTTMKREQLLRNERRCLNKRKAIRAYLKWQMWNRELRNAFPGNERRAYSIKKVKDPNFRKALDRVWAIQAQEFIKKP